MDFTYETLQVEVINKVAVVQFNRPSKANSFNETSWKEIKAFFEAAHRLPEIRAIVLSGKGKHFCGGIDLKMLLQLDAANRVNCEGRTRENMRNTVLFLQSCLTAINKCCKPVLAAIHGGCIGAGVDLITACDMRYCTSDAYFTIKEIDMGLVADLGTLQRLPKLIGQGITRELAFTGRKMSSQEAKNHGLVNRVFKEKVLMQGAVMQIAMQIADKSPLVVRGTKEMLNYAQDHSVQDGLNYVATWNAGMIISNDLQKSMMAAMKKEKAVFED